MATGSRLPLSLDCEALATRIAGEEERGPSRSLGVDGCGWKPTPQEGAHHTRLPSVSFRFVRAGSYLGRALVYRWCIVVVVFCFNKGNLVHTRTVFDWTVRSFPVFVVPADVV